MNISDHQQQGKEQPRIVLLNAMLVLQHHLTGEMVWHLKEENPVRHQNLCLQNTPRRQKIFARPAGSKEVLKHVNFEDQNTMQVKSR